MDEGSRTAAATRTRMRRSEDKLARRLIDRGWMCWRTGADEAQGWDPRVPRNGLQVYATNAMGETYRVLGWTPDIKPILAGSISTDVTDGEFVGLFEYVFTVGPK